MRVNDLPVVAQIVGQPIVAAAGFQPAFAKCEGSQIERKSRLKGGCGQDCPPHNKCRMLRGLI
jgi:hypothetical protein